MSQTGLDAEDIIKRLGDKLSQANVREVMQEAYAEQLEGQIASLQEQIRELKGGSNGLAKVSNSETVRSSNGAEAKR